MILYNLLCISPFLLNRSYQNFSGPILPETLSGEFDVWLLSKSHWFCLEKLMMDQVQQRDLQSRSKKQMHVFRWLCRIKKISEWIKNIHEMDKKISTNWIKIPTNYQLYYSPSDWHTNQPMNIHQFPSQNLPILHVCFYCSITVKLPFHSMTVKHFPTSFFNNIAQAITYLFKLILIKWH